MTYEALRQGSDISGSPLTELPLFQFIQYNVEFGAMFACCFL